MSTKIEIDQKNVTVTVSGESPLTEVSFGIEAALSNFLGRRMTRFECRRSKAMNGDCILEFTALCPAGPMLISKVMSLRDAERQGLFPVTFPEQNSFLNEPGAPFHNQVLDGQHQHRGITQTPDGQTSVVENQEINPDFTIAGVCYSLADMLTGLFALGVNYVKWQGSVKRTQLCIRHKFDQKKLHDYLRARQDYDLARKAKTL